MNRLILLPEELQGSTAVLTGERARYVLDTHELTAGLEVSAAVWQGARGRVRVAAAASERVVLEVCCSEPPLPAVPLELIVAVPRPQTVRKLLELAAPLGIQRLHFVRTWRTVKSYLSSKMLQADSIKRHLIRGLEQAGDSMPAEVRVHPLFKPFVTEALPDLLREESTLALLADTHAALGLTELQQSLETEQQRVLIAVGPEAGWSRGEVAQFEELGFQSVGLGPRMLRVDTAVSVLAAQTALLRQAFAESGKQG